MSLPTSDASPYRTATVEAGGHTFHLTEPDWRFAGKAVALYLPLIGNRAEVDAMVDDILAAVKAAGDDEAKRKKDALEIIFDDDTVRAMDPDDIAELLGLVTDHDKDWFLEPGRLNYKAMVALLQGVAEVLPFAPVLASKGIAGLALVNSWFDSSGASQGSSESGADGDPTKSQDTESGGASTDAGTSTSATPPASSLTQ